MVVRLFTRLYIAKIRRGDGVVGQGVRQHASVGSIPKMFAPGEKEMDGQTENRAEA